MSEILIHSGVTHSIVGGFFVVYNYYGYGLAESIYAGALELELADRGHHVAREVAVEVSYKGGMSRGSVSIWSSTER
jgi:GxxExxY protein